MATYGWGIVTAEAKDPGITGRRARALYNLLTTDTIGGAFVPTLLGGIAGVFPSNSKTSKAQVTSRSRGGGGPSRVQPKTHQQFKARSGQKPKWCSYHSRMDFCR